MVTNAGAEPGDKLILTKPLGTGIISTALKGKMSSPEAEEAMIAVMVELNRVGAKVMQEVGAQACTDITGFGLLGHALEMANASHCGMVLRTSQVPILSSSPREYAQMGLVPAGTYANRNYCHQSLTVDPAIPAHILDILADAQTSGGLLISVTENRATEMLEKLKARGIREAAVIGEVTAGPPGTITLFALIFSLNWLMASGRSLRINTARSIRLSGFNR